MHNRRKTSHHISFRADSFVPQDFLSQEGSVSEHRKSNWWYAPRSDNKGKNRGRADKVQQGQFNR